MDKAERLEQIADEVIEKIGLWLFSEDQEMVRGALREAYALGQPQWIEGGACQK